MIEHYLTETGVDLFQEWYDDLADMITQRAISRRMISVANGSFGLINNCGEGVWEFKFDIGPGYRVYYARSEDTVVLLLCGGDKRKQQADIRKAKQCWKDWQKRKSEERKQK